MKNKNILILAVICGLIVIVNLTTAYAQIKPKMDLSFRQALYNARNVTDGKVDRKAVYAVPGKTLTLKKSDATYCLKDVCDFRFGVLVFRDPAKNKFSAIVSAQNNQGGGASGFVNPLNTAAFPMNGGTAETIFMLKLKVGEVNIITLNVHPGNEGEETDFSNNKFSVSIKLEP